MDRHTSSSQKPATKPPAPSFEETARIIRGIEVFRELDAGTQRLLSDASQPRRFASGKELWGVGEPSTHLVIVVRGLVKMTRPTATGTVAIDGLFGPRDILGARSLLAHVPHAAAAQAAAEVQVVEIDGRTVIERAGIDPALAVALQRALLAHIRVLEDTVAIVSAGSVGQRLATLLCRLAERFGDELEDGTTLVPIPLPRKDLACFIHATVETTIRRIRVLERLGVVKPTRRGFVIARMDYLKTVASGGERLHD
jgi:CRP/FNR family cyclic AMP-dependent transcriptional regulator